MIVAGLPIPPAELAVVPPALLPDSGQVGETSAGWGPPAAGDVPRAWLAALAAALAAAAGESSEPPPGEAGSSSGEEPAERPAPPPGGEDAPEAEQPVAPTPLAALAGATAPVTVTAGIWTGWEYALDPAAPVSGPNAADAASEVVRRARVRPADPSAAWRPEEAAGEPSGGSVAPAQPFSMQPLSMQPRPERPAQDGEVAFRAKVTQRPVSPAGAAAPVAIQPGERRAEGDAKPESAPAGGRQPAGKTEPGGEARLAARPEPVGAAEAAPARASQLEPASHRAGPRPAGPAPVSAGARPTGRAAPGEQVATVGEREPVRTEKAARSQPTAAPAAEVAAPAATDAAAVRQPVTRQAPLGEIRPPAVPDRAPAREPARRIELRLSETSESGVSLHVVDRSGRVEVAVRTADRDLAGSLREALPALVRRMEHAGFRAEAWAPETAPARLAETPEAPRAAMDLADRGGGRRQPGGGEPDGERGQARDRRAEFEPGERSGEEGKENERWAAWRWR